VIAADTEVVLNGTILGKPADMDDAMAMLGRLSGNTHLVISAVIIIGSKLVYHNNKSLVHFRKTTRQERQWYCDNFSPLDKAGAYGIQDAAAAFIDRFEGSYSGVMGLPLKQTRQLLQQAGINTA
ncbi:MAG: Maf family protein, partial [Gammaproteobacteria bacterium]|nr:Maf family protein [Gammaproteobacteria bacterium]